MIDRNLQSSDHHNKHRKSLFSKVFMIFRWCACYIFSFFKTMCSHIMQYRIKRERTKRLTRARRQMMNAKIANSLNLYDDFDPQTPDAEQGTVTFEQHKTYFSYNGLSKVDAAYNALLIKLRDRSLRSERRLVERMRKSDSETILHASCRKIGFNIYDVLLGIMMIPPLLCRLYHYLIGSVKHALHLCFRILHAGENPHQSMRGIGRFFKKYTATLIPLALFAFTAWTIYRTVSQDIEFGLSVDGEYVGIVESTDMLNNARTAVEKYVSDSIGVAYKFDKKITYEFCYAEKGKSEKLSYAELYSALFQYGTSDYVSAYALYVDGKMVGAVSSYNDAEKLIEEVKAEHLAAMGLSDSDGKIQISNHIRIINQLCVPATIMPCEELKALMLGDVSKIDMEVSISTALSSISNNKENATSYISDSLNMDFNNTYYIPEEKVEEMTSVLAQARLDFSIEKTEVVEQEIPFEVVYEESPYYYKDEIILKQNGVPGKKQVTYSVVYANDTEIGRTAVLEDVISNPTNAVYYIGTKPLPSTDANGYFIYPLRSYVLTSEYGSRDLFGEYNFHLGIDLYARSGTSIYAADGGKVIFAGWHNSYGNFVLIDHQNGFVTAYAHQSELLVQVGDEVYQGQVIGKVGETGNAYGTHLHFEVRKNGVIVNPMYYLK